MKYSYFYDDFEAINRMRREYGLRVIARKKTNCLRCSKEFLSLDYPRNRICIRCNSEDEFDPEAYGKISMFVPNS